VINDILVKPVADVVHGSDTVSEIGRRPGGSAANQAAWMGSLGLDVVFAGRCGAADADFHRNALAAYGVHAVLTADPEAETGSIVIMVGEDGERTMFTDRGANLRLRCSDVPSGLLDGAALLHLTGYTFFSPGPRAVALSLIDEARSRGIAVTIDPGSAAFLAQLAPGEFLTWTADAAACFPNLAEAAVLTSPDPDPDPVVLATELAKHYGLVVLKLGAGGCVLAGPGAEPVQIAAQPVVVEDTTGAGDAFCAAFLSRWLANGGLGLGDVAGLGGAAEFAVRIAASAVTSLGGRPAGGNGRPAGGK
jgi:sugar/nucleoside kinase (ribokinase family)